MRAHILAHVRPGQERDVISALNHSPGVIHAVYTFGPFDVIVEAEAPDLPSLGNIVFESVRSQPGVIDTLTCLDVE